MKLTDYIAQERLVTMFDVDAVTGNESDISRRRAVTYTVCWLGLTCAMLLSCDDNVVCLLMQIDFENASPEFLSGKGLSGSSGKAVPIMGSFQVTPFLRRGWILGHVHGCVWLSTMPS